MVKAPRKVASPDWIKRESCNVVRGALWEECPLQRGGETVERDPVCGMQVDPTKAAGTSEYQGKTYVFCSVGCKRKFDSNPQQYAGK
jgi:YHS domain-containing protein